MAKLSPVFNEAQFINGIPAYNAQIFTYAAGSTTPLTTYADEAGTIQNPNPMRLDARGEPTTPFWLTEGLAYKFVFTSSTDTDPPTSPIRTIDNVTGVGDNSIVLSQWVDTGLNPTYINPTTFTVPGDQTSEIHPNRRIKANVTAGTVYGYISGSVYDGVSITTVTVTLDSGVLDSGLSSFQLGLITAEDTSLPQIPNSIRTDMIQNDAITARTLNDSAQGFVLTNGYFTATPAANAITVAVKTKAGADPTVNDPVLVRFRSATLTDGNYYVRSITSALAITVSAGSTLGTVNAVASNIQILVIDNAGTVELAVVNNSGALQLNENTLVSTTAEGGAGAADSYDVIYSTTARANVPYRNVGYFTSTQATAGTWVTAPSQIQQYSIPPVAKGNSWVYLPVYTTTGFVNIDLPVTGTIPSWVQDIEVIFELSTNGNIDLWGQIGDAGGIESGGYDSNCVQAAGGGNAVSSSTGAFIISNNMAAADTYKGVWRLRKKDGNTWQSDAITKRSNTSILTMSGDKTLSDVLTSLRFITATAVNTFDVVNVVVRYR